MEEWRQRLNIKPNIFLTKDCFPDKKLGERKRMWNRDTKAKRKHTGQTLRGGRPEKEKEGWAKGRETKGRERGQKSREERREGSRAMEGAEEAGGAAPAPGVPRRCP